MNHFKRDEQITPLTTEAYFLDRIFCYTWKIHDFHKSPYYDVGVMTDKLFVFEGAQYQLKIQNCTGMSITLNSDFKSKVPRIFYHFCVITKDEKNIVQSGQIFHNSIPTLWIDPNCVKNDVIIKGCVTLKCKLTSRRTVESTIPQKEEDLGVEGLSADFASLYLNKLQADARIRVEGKDIEAHSQILSARSPVFAALFQSGMAECDNRTIEVKDVGESAMNYLLRYIYTGLLEVEDFSATTVVDLYVAAEKYDVRGLQALCKQQMMSTLSEENLQHYVEVALMYEDQDLTHFIANFVVNRPDIIGSEPWQKLVDKIPKFGLMVLNAMAKVIK